MNFDGVLFNKRADEQSLEAVQKERHEEALFRFSDWCHSQEHYDSAPITGSQEAVAELALENDLHIITTRPRCVEVPTRRWLKKYFPEQFRGLCFIGGADESTCSAAEVCYDLGVSHFIGSLPEHALQIARSKVRVSLFDHSWNRGVSARNITRFFSWKEVRDSAFFRMVPASL